MAADMGEPSTPPRRERRIFIVSLIGIFLGSLILWVGAQALSELNDPDILGAFADKISPFIKFLVKRFELDIV